MLKKPVYVYMYEEVHANIYIDHDQIICIDQKRNFLIYKFVYEDA